MGNAIEPKHHGPDPQWYKDPSHRGKGRGQQLLYPNADITPPPALHAGHGRRTTGVCASTPFLRILGQPQAANGDLSLVILRQEERPENHRYSRSSLNLAYAEPPAYQSKAGSCSHYR